MIENLIQITSELDNACIVSKQQMIRHLQDQCAEDYEAARITTEIGHERAIYFQDKAREESSAMRYLLEIEE